MVTPSTAQLPPPKSWDEFEDICANLFGEEWQDRNTTRYGRSGERQNGVDIYGRPDGSGYAGVQCKGQRNWPPSPLTKSQIDEEVEKAKAFSPALTEFTIATTAQDTVKLQDHARDITERHKGLFSVHIVGWLELTRRLNKHPKLVEVHFSFIGFETLRDEVRQRSEKTAALVLEGIHRLNLPAASARSDAASFDAASAFRTGIGESIERDLSIRYSIAVRRAMFPEISKQDEFQAVAQEIADGQYDEASSELRRRVLLRALEAEP